jgi:hypothetical protein
MKKKAHYPAIHLQRCNETNYRASVGLSVVSILDPRLRGGDEEEDEHIRIYEAHHALLQAVVCWPENVTLQLNLVSKPDIEYPLRGKIEITLFLSVTACEKHLAMAEVLSRHTVLIALLNNHLPAVEFRSILDLNELAGRLTPFKSGSAVSIERRRERLSIAIPASSQDGEPIGFLTSFTAPQKGPAMDLDSLEIPYLFPWTPATRDFSEIVEALLWHPAPFWLNVRVRPISVPAATVEGLTEALRKCEEFLLHRQGEKTVLEVQTRALRSAIAERLQQLGEHVLQGSVFLCSPVDLDEAIISTVADTISARPRETDSDIVFKGGYQARSISPGAVCDPGFFSEEEPFTASEIVCALRIPHPQKSSCPGLPIKRFRTVLAEPTRDADDNEKTAILGMSVHRGYEQPVMVSADDRMRHMCILGQTGTGKSTLLQHLIIQDIRGGRGLCLLDPHGELVEAVLNRYPEERKGDLVLIDFVDRDFYIPMNFLKWRTPEERDFIIDELYATIDRLYDLRQTGGPMFEQYFRGMLRLLMGDRPRKEFVPTLLDFHLVFQESGFRRLCAHNTHDPQVLRIVEEAEEAGGDAKLANMAPYITSKLSRFVLDATLKRTIGQEEMALDFRKIMDQGKVVLINLGKGRFGAAVSGLIAGQIVSRFKAAAMSRADTPPEARRDFFLYVDEFQNVAHDSFVELLAEARKYRLGIVLANQYADQLEKVKRIGGDSMLAAILGNVGTITAFRLGIKDAFLLEPVFGPVFNRNDLTNLPNWHCYVSSNTAQDKPIAFSMQTVYEAVERAPAFVEELRNISRNKYARKAGEVDWAIKERTERINRLMKEEL